MVVGNSVKVIVRMPSEVCGICTFLASSAESFAHYNLQMFVSDNLKRVGFCVLTVYYSAVCRKTVLYFSYKFSSSPVCRTELLPGAQFNFGKYG